MRADSNSFPDGKIIKHTRLFLLLLTCAWLGLSSATTFGAEPDSRYYRSSDGSTEAVYMFNKVALVQHRDRGTNGGFTFRYQLARAHSGDEPDQASANNPRIEDIIVEKIDKGCWVKLPSGMHLLLSGYASVQEAKLPSEQQARIAAEKQRVYWLINETQLIKATTLEELAHLVSEWPAKSNPVTFKDSPTFFKDLRSWAMQH